MKFDWILDEKEKLKRFHIVQLFHLFCFKQKVTWIEVHHAGCCVDCRGQGKKQKDQIGS